MDLLDELQTRVLCGDGAMGTMLLEDGISRETCLEELCLTQPKRIETVHEKYICAGARVIETNSFGANAVRLERFGLEDRVAEINRAAAQVASKAARGKKVYVAGSVGPLGLTGKEALSRGVDRRDLFREQIKGLLEGGADLIFFETFMECEEMEIAFQAGKDVGAGLAVCSFVCDPEGRISPGVSLANAFARLRVLGAQIMGVNCLNGPAGVVQLLRLLPAEYLLAAYPSAGLPKYHEGRFIYQLGPESFAHSARELVGGGARLVGGCCGTNPKHIAAVAAAIENMRPARG